MFTSKELKRVGVAATMLVVCGTVVIIAMTMMLGHYNSLAHSGPKAAVDGVVIALLIGQHGRWRCLTLLGVVYGLVLLLQVGVFYLLPVTVVAAMLAAVAGRCVEPLHRPAAIVLAAITYELLAGCGAPIKIYFGTGGRSEPFLWGMWFAEWPLRIVGAAVGVWLAGRIRRSDAIASESISTSSPPSRPKNHRSLPAGIAILMSLIACTLPLFIESGWILGLLAAAYIAYALLAGVRWGIFHAGLAMLWGWIVFGAFSYAWNRDLAIVFDFGRTLVLRFAPLTLGSIVLVTAVRPIEMLRFLRRLRLPAAVLIPFTMVMRSIPQARMTMRASIQRLRDQGHWRGPLSLFRRPGMIFRELLAPQVNRWARQLCDDSTASDTRNAPL